MPLFDAITLNRFAQQGENEFVKIYKCIIDRISLDIVSGTSTYNIPDYVQDIRKITWLGHKIDPISHRKFRDFEFNASSVSSKPECYVFNNIGQNQIKFFPTPNVTIASINSNLFGSQILYRVIVEFFRFPDYVSQIIPFYFRKRYIKAYVLKCCFSMEGRGQNIKAAKYWNDKYLYLREVYGSSMEETINSARRIFIGGRYETNVNRAIPPLYLPYDKRGIGVDPGE